MLLIRGKATALESKMLGVKGDLINQSAASDLCAKVIYSQCKSCCSCVTAAYACHHFCGDVSVAVSHGCSLVAS